jgi:hypothetical protein
MKRGFANHDLSFLLSRRDFGDSRPCHYPPTKNLKILGATGRLSVELGEIAAIL